MANIVKYDRVNSYNSSSVRRRGGKIVDVSCVYETQTLSNGSKALVIKTYNPNSKSASISQTIHFTENSAKQLINILKRELKI